jgi:hypothetical protein
MANAHVETRDLNGARARLAAAVHQGRDAREGRRPGASALLEHHPAAVRANAAEARTGLKWPSN